MKTQIILILNFVLFSFFAEAKTKTYISDITKIEYTSTEIGWDLKTHQSKTLQLNIPDNAISFTIYAYSENPENKFKISALQNPLKKKIDAIQNTALVGSLTSLLFPDRPENKISAGNWNFSVQTDNTQAAATNKKNQAPPTVVVLIKTLKNKVALNEKVKGDLSINLQFTGGNSLTAANALTDPQFSNHLTKLINIYKKYGINLLFDKNNFTDLKTKDLDIEIGYDSDQIFNRGSSNESINLIFAQRLYLGNDQLKGLSGTTVGPYLIKNSPSNAVVLATNHMNLTTMQEQYEKSFSTVMAHEIGHYLGLPHICDDASAGIVDQFSDTPPKEDTSYLMNATDAGASKNILSPQQRQFLLLSPTIKLFTE